MAELAILPPRQRLLDALAASIERRGYRQSTVAEVVAIARTSRRTFYEHFPDRETCFLALFEQTTQEMLERVVAAVDPELPWERQVEDAIDAYIAALVERPALHQSFVRELPALGLAGAERQRLVVERFARMLVELVEAARRRRSRQITGGLVPRQITGGLCPRQITGGLSLELAIVLVAGLRELLVLSMQQGRDPREMRGTARVVGRALLGELLGEQ
jgi:AcrR family transcriptional regulator